MAHFIIEYTHNIAADANIPALLRKANEVLIAQDGIFPIGGIRSRATEIRKRTGDALFEMLKEHFAELYARRYLALSMEIYEFDEAGTWKHNNVHAKFRKEPLK